MVTSERHSETHRGKPLSRAAVLIKSVAAHGHGDTLMFQGKRGAGWQGGEGVP